MRSWSLGTALKDEIKLQLKLSWYEVLAELTGRADYYAKARGLKELQIHVATERAKVTWEFKRYIKNRANNTCYLCGHYNCWQDEKPMVVEHKLPLIRGGYTTYENCDWACWHCNQDKGTQTPVEYWKRQGKI